MGIGNLRYRHWRMVAWAIAALILLLPLIAMQFTDEVNWDAADFLVMAIMLGALLAALEIIQRLARRPLVFAMAAGFAVLAFLLIWAELAVGLL